MSSPDECVNRAMPLTSHLGELKRRLIIMAAAITVGSVVSFVFAEEILQWLGKPLAHLLPAGTSFVALSPIEGWIVYFKISLLSSLVITSPLWLYEIIAFVAPGMIKKRKRQILLAAGASWLFFICGCLVCFYVIMPYGFGFLLSILAESDIVLLPQISVYVSFVTRMIFAFGLVFQMPILCVLLARWKIVGIDRLARFRKYAIVGSFVVAAIITPPDVVTQVAVALPLIALFEASIIAARLFAK